VQKQGAFAAARPIEQLTSLGQGTASERFL
jgi:hypothetical protein